MHNADIFYAKMQNVKTYKEIMLCTILFHIHQNFDCTYFGGRRKKEKNMIGNSVIGYFNLSWNTFIHILTKHEVNVKKIMVLNS